jgi:hypothetical protein
MSISDFLPELPATIARTTLEQLRSALPLPIPDTPENRASRDQAAFGAVAALRPANAADAVLAIMIVAAQAHASECLRRADELRHDPRMVGRLRTLANRMMREALSSLDLLRECQRRAPRPAAGRPPAPPLPGAPQCEVSRPAPQAADDAAQKRAARIRALDLRVIETPPTRH